MKKLGEYKNGNYTVSIYSDGTKIRQTEDDVFVPSFSENCDVNITDRCSVGCAFCYQGCTPDGEHGELMKWKWLESLHPYTELALNGNDMDHPQLREFLEYLKEKKVIANITVNAKQFIENIYLIKELKKDGLIYGIGVSVGTLLGVFIDSVEKSKEIDDVVFHTINGVTGETMYKFLADRGCKVLILGYKDLGRGVQYKANSKAMGPNAEWLEKNLPMLISKCAVVSFDNLALEQLNVKSLLTPEQWESFYMGDDGQFTFYMDLVKGEYAKNSLDQRKFKIGNKSIDEMFEHIRTIK